MKYVKSVIGKFLSCLCISLNFRRAQRCPATISAQVCSGLVWSSLLCTALVWSGHGQGFILISSALCMLTPTRSDIEFQLCDVIKNALQRSRSMLKFRIFLRCIESVNFQAPLPELARNLSGAGCQQLAEHRNDN